jgi:hypothetical protein
MPSLSVKIETQTGAGFRDLRCLLINGVVLPSLPSQNISESKIFPVSQIKLIVIHHMVNQVSLTVCRLHNPCPLYFLPRSNQSIPTFVLLVEIITNIKYQNSGEHTRNSQNYTPRYIVTWLPRVLMVIRKCFGRKILPCIVAGRAVATGCFQGRIRHGKVQ